MSLPFFKKALFLLKQGFPFLVAAFAQAQFAALPAGRLFLETLFIYLMGIFCV
jgi:hypothetical protein